MAAARSILLVDDDPLIREIAAEHLQEMGLQVVQASSAEEAMSILGSGKASIRLVMSDVMMPGANGLTLARFIRAWYPKLPLILVSGVYAPQAIVDELGPETMFAAKPYDLDALGPQILALTDRDE